MKISKLFHWLYATLMFLPVLVLPAFMIYSHRHTIDSYHVNYAQNQIVDFNQLVVNGQPNNLDTYTLTDSNSGSIVYNDNSIQYNLVTYYGDYRNGFGNYYYDGNGINVIANHKYYSCYTAMSNEVSYIYCAGDSGVSYGVNSRLLLGSNYQTLSYIFTPDTNVLGNRYFYIQKYDVDLSSNYYCRIKFNMLVDLTQMYGAGNEPSIADFELFFPNDYYEYTTSKKILLKDVNTITYNDTDIGSQIIYNLYNVTNNYFNFSNFFSFNGIYDWLLINFFNGNAPLGFALFWQWLCYWVLISIFWLIFDLVMYVPKLAHKWLDKASIE